MVAHLLRPICWKVTQSVVFHGMTQEGSGGAIPKDDWIAISFGLAAAVTFGLLYFRRILNHLAACQRTLAGLLPTPRHEHEYQILYERSAGSKVVKSSRRFRQVLVLRDADLIKTVVAKDFEYFTDRRSGGNSSELFDLDGEIWRVAGERIRPFFSAEPLRALFEYFTSNLGTLVTRISQKGSPADISGPIGVCVADIVSLAIFGLKITIGHKKDEFTRHALSIIAEGPFRSVEAFLCGRKRMPWEAEKYFKGFLTEKFQSPNGSESDFVQLLSLAREKKAEEIGKSSENQNLSKPLEDEDVELSDDVLHDAVLQFLTSGLEPIVSAIIFVLYDLSREPNTVQTKVREEIVSSVAKNFGYNYEAVRQMTLLDSCVRESLRLHPPVHSINRTCVKDYASADGISFNEGDSIAISILGVHYDEKHFPEPRKYMPHRFENDEATGNFFYMPFGRGPRKCVGDHYARLVIKTIVAKLIYQFKFSLSESSSNNPPHRVKGPYVVPNDISFNIELAHNTSLLK